VLTAGHVPLLTSLPTIGKDSMPHPTDAARGVTPPPCGMVEDSQGGG
jgi:hypothetical protein